MTSQKLANVLLKIIGLYVCLLAIPSCVSGILLAFSGIGAKTDTTAIIMRTGTYAIGAAIQAVAGIVIIVQSRNIAEFWFKNEDH